MRNPYVGGENYYSPLLYFQKKKTDIDDFIEDLYPDKYHYSTFGGYFSLMALLHSLKISKVQTVLLPSYLCPSILNAFKKTNVSYRFYRVNENLEIDINDVKSKIDRKTKALVFINYFGKKPSILEKDFFTWIKNKDIILIEDMVQNFLSSRIYGNFAFNSFRKFLPFDASIIITDIKLEFENSGTNRSYLLRKKFGQRLRYLQVNFGIKSEKLFLKLFSHAEENYHLDKVIDISNTNKFLLSRIDFDDVISKRIKIYNLLLEYFKEITLFKEKLDFEPTVGLPVVIKDSNRDQIRKQLISKNIFCPVHWKLPDEVSKKEFHESWFLSDHILTIPTNQLMRKKEVEHIIKTWQTIH